MMNNIRQSMFVLFVTCGFLLAFVAPLNAAELLSLSGKTMGTTYSVKIAAFSEGVTAEALQAEIDTCLHTVNRQMSTWQSDSELSLFNRFDQTDWFPVSADTARVVQTALDVSRETDGAFDVTVGPLVNLWNFGPNPQNRKLPDESIIDATRASVGYRLLEARQDPPALRKTRPEVYVDLSAIAKGFGVDQVAGVLDRHSLDNYMVEIGGEVRTKGQKPDGSLWRIGIETPTPNQRGLQDTVALSGEALATSGDYRNFVEIEGKRYSHTIDPRTGWPVDHALTSVSVISDSCMLADAYATSLMVLGPEAGYNWAVKRNIAALFIVREGDRFVEKPTPAFVSYLSTKPKSSMTTTWLIAAGVFLVAVLLMSVGVLLGKRCITGSCGGLANMQDEHGRTLCESCSNPAPECQGQADAKNRAAEETPASTSANE